MSFDPDWTYLEAYEANRKVTEKNPRALDSEQPLMQWLHHHSCMKLKQRYENGDHYALLQAVRMSGSYGIPIPDWAAKGFSRALHNYEQLNDMTLDDAFQVSRKGLHVEAWKKKRALRLKVHGRVKEYSWKDNPPAIDEALFNRVGDEFGVSGSLVRDCYYEVEGKDKAFLSSYLPVDLLDKPPLTKPKK